MATVVIMATATVIAILIAMVIVILIATVMVILIATATITMAMDIPTDITYVAGMVIADHGVAPDAGDDFKNSEATSSILNLKLGIVTPLMTRK